MKKIQFLLPLIAIIVISIKCNTVKTSKMDAIPKEKALSFTADILPIMQTSCTPCHFPPDGRKKPLENYANVKENNKKRNPYFSRTSRYCCMNCGTCLRRYCIINRGCGRG